jgi:hypothetical protein
MLLRLTLAATVAAVLASSADAGPILQRRRHAVAGQSCQPAADAAPPGPRIEYTPHGQPMPDSPAGEALAEVNAKRAARGLPPLLPDPGLTEGAFRVAAFRAHHGLFGHTSNDFGFLPPGSSASSGGCAAYPASYGWMSCCVYDRATYGGAAFVTGTDGRRYMHLFVR